MFIPANSRVLVDSSAAGPGQASQFEAHRARGHAIGFDGVNRVLFRRRRPGVIKALARRVAVVDFVPALLQVEVADVHVFVEATLRGGPVGAQQGRAGVHHFQASHRIACRDVGRLYPAVAVEVGRQGRSVAQGARSEERHHEVRPVADAPHRQRLAQVFVVLLDAHLGGHVEHPEDAQRGVDQHPSQVRGTVAALALEQVVDAGPDVLDVAEEVADGHFHRQRRHFVVADRQRLEHRLVHPFIEGVHGAVVTLPRIARVTAGGGTAGHVEPALAVATWLKGEKPDWLLTFVGTKNGLENQLVPKAGFDLIHIPKVLMPRQVTPSTFLWPIKIIYATFKAFKICREADLVIGFGGYACPPIYLAAAILRKPIFIHEANAIPGWANRLGAAFASEIFIAFSRTKLKLGKWRNAKLSGMPIRAEIIASSKLSAAESQAIKNNQLDKWQLSRDKPTILVFGGSQGSRHINEAIMQSLSAFTERNVQVVHSVGRSNALPTSTENYLPLSYIEDMSSAYHAADLIIARSGALTCAELAAVGKFAILIPLPIGNGEQSANAADLQAAGAAEVIDDNKFNSGWLISNWTEIWRKASNYRPTNWGEFSASEVIGKAIIEKIGRSK